MNAILTKWLLTCSYIPMAVYNLHSYSLDMGGIYRNFHRDNRLCNDIHQVFYNIRVFHYIFVHKLLEL